MEYKFTQNWTKEDYVAFAVNHLLQNFLKTRNLILYTVSIGYLILTPLLTQRWEFFYVGIGLIVLFIGYLFMAKRSAAKGYDRNKESLSIEFTLNESGLMYETGEGIVTENWQNFTYVKETEKHFFMYFAAHKGFLLAKRDLSEDMIIMIRRGLQTHVVNQKRIKLLG